LVVLACCLCHASPARSGDVSPPDRAESLTMMFRTICLIEAPNAAHSAARAAGMRMALLGDTTTRTEGDTVTRSRRWSGDPNIGGWRLRVDEVSGPASSAVVCALGGAMADTARFFLESSSLLGLPLRTSITEQPHYIWHDLKTPWATPGTTITIRGTRPGSRALGMAEIEVRIETPR